MYIHIYECVCMLYACMYGTYSLHGIFYFLRIFLKFVHYFISGIVQLCDCLYGPLKNFILLVYSYK